MPAISLTASVQVTLILGFLFRVSAGRILTGSAICPMRQAATLPVTMTHR